MPRIYANLYERPEQGGAFIERLEVYNYRHKISAIGGYDTASFDLADYALDADFWFDRLGCEIRIFIDNPAFPCWEGFVNRVNLAVGALTYTSSLDDLFNRTSVTYSAPDVGAAPQNTTAVNNLDSQAIFGVKEGALDGYVIRGTDVTKFTKLQAMVLNNQAYPQKSTIFNPQGQGAGLYTVECLGWHHTLQWVKYFNSSTTGTDDADVILRDALATYPNSAFFDVTDEADISGNPSFSQNERSQTNQTYWELFQSIQEAGDGSSRWVMGITPTRPNGLRRFYYRPNYSETRYILRSNEGRIRDTFGQLVEPWKVIPDCSIKVADYAVGWSKTVGNDPTIFYADTVDYDSNSQSVQIGSTDNITVEGAMQLKTYFKTTGRRFGAPQRRAWS